jgi:hypothetical protein
LLQKRLLLLLLLLVVKVRCHLLGHLQVLWTCCR